ncbi:multicopper oxidase domain-containing protein [Candidatus Poribacteria bacterium]|nr:multicopper oxidase domain-containing protein [Candidatus Poribacteria bacterium]MYK18562.1 multicopper oxidase domain-containing protein [Candidatus Poribacteria bacterium]
MSLKFTKSPSFTTRPHWLRFLSLLTSYKLIAFTSVLLFYCTTFVEATTREYWIAAEKVEWNYAPSGENLIRPAMGLDVWGKALVYEKYRYIQYTDDTYTTQVEQPVWMGILGPQLHAVEGDSVKVHFLNRADKPLSIHVHGLQYDEDNEGADMKGSGAAVQPGSTFTYHWEADSDAAPGPNDPSSIVWLYHSHVDAVTEVYDGLIGTIVVTKKGMERSIDDPRPKDIDKAFTTLFLVFDENGRKIVKNGQREEYESTEEAEEGNLKHAINGFIFGNLQGLEVEQGDKVRWYLIGLGTEVDMHTAHWHGQTVLNTGKRTDVVELLPGSMVTVDMTAKTPGNWLYHCHVADHITAGMNTRWRVVPKR